MTEKFIGEVIKGAVGSAIDIALSTHPVMAIAWGAIKAGANATRKERATELIVFVEQYCTVEQFNDPDFVDGIAITFEAFIRERNAEKRRMIQNIFLGFASAKDKESFELERLYETSKLISVSQLEAFTLFSEQKSIELLCDGRGKTFTHERIEDLRSLASLGLVTIDLQIDVEAEDEMEGDGEDGSQSTGRLVPVMRKTEFTDITTFGAHFLSYIKNPSACKEHQAKLDEITRLEIEIDARLNDAIERAQKVMEKTGMTFEEALKSLYK